MKIKPAPTPALPSDVEALSRYGLVEGQTLRFRRHEGRWMRGKAVAVDGDGSIGVRDDRGRRRSVPAAQVEAETTGPRGGKSWAEITKN